MINLRSVDLNLLPIFEAAYEERSLSRAATRLAMTQPAVSHALSRLRVVFRDELFIRHSRGVTPTPVADAIYAKLGEALGLVRAAVTEGRGFDPKASERKFVVAIPHPLGPMLALAAIDRMRTAAPKITLSFSTQSRPLDLESSLLDGRVDLSVDWLPPKGRSLASEVLFEDALVAVARRGHPALKRSVGLKAMIARWEAVVLRPREDVTRHSLEGVRQWNSVKGRVALEVSEILEILAVAAQSDLIGLVPKSIASVGQRLMGVQLVPGLPKTKPHEVLMAWRSNRTADPAHAFLRTQIRAAVKAVIKA
jgi:DNA-binding transcriptional LysR family regulator